MGCSPAVKLPEVMRRIHVVVDHVEKHGQAAAMAGIDEMAQVVGATVEHLRRVVVARVIGFPLRAAILAGGQELDGVEVHAADVVELGFELCEGGRAAIGIGVDSEAIATPGERADMGLVDDEALEGGSAKGGGEGERGRINHERGQCWIGGRHLAGARIDPQEGRAAGIVRVSAPVGDLELIAMSRGDTADVNRPVRRVRGIPTERQRLERIRVRWCEPHVDRAGVRRPDAETGP
jgi:hypothetical protein